MATILTIIPYRFYPPYGGGALRCFYILREMARHHTVYVLTSQPETDFSEGPVLQFLQNVHLISTYNTKKYNSIFNILPTQLADAFNYRLLTCSLKGPTNTALLEVYPILLKLLAEVKFDLVYYESLEALDLNYNLIKRMNEHALHLYDAHNVDSELWEQQAIVSNDDQKFRKYAQKSLALEKSLYKKINSFFCCSDIDYRKLVSLNQGNLTGTVIPNGVDTVSKPFDVSVEKHKIKNILFCGSLDYLPNKNGLLWFYDHVFNLLKQQLPETTLTVIGNITNDLEYKALIADSTVNFIGKVESVVPFYQNTSVAIVPLLSGSGTRLKILEAMSMGNPIVSTSIGAEGIVYNQGVHLIIADSAPDFANSIVSLLSNRDQFEQLRSEALCLVKAKYSWDIIGYDINYYLRSLLSNNLNSES